MCTIIIICIFYTTMLFILRFFFDNDNQPLYILIGEPHNSVMYISDKGSPACAVEAMRKQIPRRCVIGYNGKKRVAPAYSQNHKVGILCVNFAACTFVFPPKFQFPIFITEILPIGFLRAVQMHLRNQQLYIHHSLYIIYNLYIYI
uniref:Uncharacterized protein n=1 Tax=Schizaphis graminum TaxID=13262 RepID=A0A2S2NW55_SCHGA